MLLYLLLCLFESSYCEINRRIIIRDNDPHPNLKVHPELIENIRKQMGMSPIESPPSVLSQLIASGIYDDDSAEFFKNRALNHIAKHSGYDSYFYFTKEDSLNVIRAIKRDPIITIQSDTKDQFNTTIISLSHIVLIYKTVCSRSSAILGWCHGYHDVLDNVLVYVDYHFIKVDDETNFKALPNNTISQLISISQLTRVIDGKHYPDTKVVSTFNELGDKKGYSYIVRDCDSRLITFEF